MDTQRHLSPAIERLLYRPREAAIVAGTSPSWIYARIADGSLKSVRLFGRMVRVRKEDLIHFMENMNVKDDRQETPAFSKQASSPDPGDCDER